MTGYQRVTIDGVTVAETRRIEIGEPDPDYCRICAPFACFED